MAKGKPLKIGDVVQALETKVNEKGIVRVRLETDDGAFVRMIQECKGQDMRLCVFNTHTLRTRCARRTAPPVRF